MHELLEQMGKDIVHEKSPNEPGRRNKLCCYEDVHEVLTENTVSSPPPPPSHLITSALRLHISSTLPYVFTSHRLCPMSSSQAEPRVFVIQSSENPDFAEVSHSKIKPKVFDLVFWGVGFLGSLLNLQDQFGCRQILEVQKDYHQEFLQLSQTSTCANYGASPVRCVFCCYLCNQHSYNLDFPQRLEWSNKY
ncbi:unnamed protein product [Prunus brigantina]